MKINQFIESIKGLSPRTQAAYRQTLYQLDQVTHGDEPTAEEIKSFLERYGASSLQRHKAAIFAYWEWRFPDLKWPFGKHQFRAARKHVPQYINPLLVEKIARAGDQDDYMYVWTAFILGARIGELMAIEAKEITDDGVRVLGKGDKYRLIPCTPEFIRDLRKYAGKKKGRIFPERYSYYYSRLKELAKIAGVDYIHPHMLRHSRAVDLRRKKLRGVALQQFMGHANYNTTAIYELIDGGELAEELQQVEANANGK